MMKVNESEKPKQPWFWKVISASSTNCQTSGAKVERQEHAVVWHSGHDGRAVMCDHDVMALLLGDCGHGLAAQCLTGGEVGLKDCAHVGNGDGTQNHAKLVT